LPPRLDESIASGLEYLARRQADDGSIVDGPALGYGTSAALPTTAAAAAATIAPATTVSTAPTTMATTTTVSTAPATAPSSAPAQMSADTTTALSLLAFLAAGNAPDVGRYGLVVRGEIEFLLAGASKDEPPRNADTFARAAAVLALAEAYGVEQRSDTRARIRHTLAKLLPVILSARAAEKDGDPRIVGWLTLALSACRDIGFDVPDDAPGAAAIAADVLRSPDAPVALDTLIKAQSPDGSWPPAAASAAGAPAGRAYTTATSVLSLTVSYKLLPLLAR
jgi:hypothetical protein